MKVDRGDCCGRDWVAEFGREGLDEGRIIIKIRIRICPRKAS